MIFTIINGYTLFPFPANWTKPPEWQRSWDTQIATAVTGDESRQAMRANPRNQLSFQVTPWSVWESAMLDDCVMAAKESGMACAPFHGRSCVLNTPASGTNAYLTDAVWTWNPGDWAFIYDPTAYPRALNYDIIQVVYVNNGNHLEFGAVDLSQTYPAGTLIWPVLFGEFTSKELQIETAQHGAFQLTIRELASRLDAEVAGAAPAGGSGIAFWKIGSTFEVGA